MNKNAKSILKNVEIALANSGDHLGPIDVGAIATLVRLSELLDYCFDSGNIDQLPQLLRQHAQLMDALKLTPKSRAVSGAPQPIGIDHGKDFAENYLRLVKAPDPKQPRERAKPRTASGATGRKPKSATDGVAKTRSRSGTDS
jgi:hypothetical protein